MKTEFLKELGVTDQAVIDKIMAEAGRELNAEKDKAKIAEQRLTEFNEKLKAFEGVDVEKLKGEVEKLRGTLSEKDAEYQRKLSDIEFDRALESALSGAKAKNIKAAAALLNIDTLKSSKNQQTDISAAIEAAKKDNAYMFDAGADDGGGSQGGRTPGVTFFSGKTPGPGVQQDGNENMTARASDALRAIIGKKSVKNNQEDITLCR